MKSTVTSPTPRLLRAAMAALSLAMAAPAMAATGTWTATASTGTWSTPGSWSGNTVADGSGFTANFTSNISSPTTITLDSARTIGNIVFSDSGSNGMAWTISGANILTLAGGTPTITTTTGATIATPIAGTLGLTKAGAQTLTLSGTNTYTGGTVVDGGTLAITTSANASATSSYTVKNGTNMTVGSATINGGAARYFSGGNTSGSNTGGTVTLNASTMLSPDQFMQLTGGIKMIVGNGATVSGFNNMHIGYTGGATGYTGMNTVEIIAGGFIGMPQQVTIGGHESGTLTQTGGTVSAGSAGVILCGYSPVGTGTYTMTGGTLTSSSAGINLGEQRAGTWNFSGGTAELGRIVATSGSGVFNFGGGTIKAMANFTVASTIPITLTGTNGAANINTNGRSVTIEGVLSSTGGLTKQGTGTLTLTANNTYTGATTINGGTLSLGGAAGALNSTGSFEISNRGSLKLDNTTNNLTRAKDSATITLADGTINFYHPGTASTTYTETIGTVTASSGSNTIQTSQASATAGVSTLTIGNLVSTGGSVNFNGEGLGTTASARNRIRISSGTPGAALGAWATINGTFPAGLDANRDVVISTSFAGYTDIDARGPSTVPDDPAAYVRILGDGSSGAIDLAAAATTVSVLSMKNANYNAVVDTSLFDDTLLTRGILLESGAKSLTIGTETGTGAGWVAPNSDGGSLALNNQSVTSTLTINAIVDDFDYTSGGLPCTVEKFGPGLVVLGNGGNTYDGPTNIHAGTLQIDGQLTSGNYNQNILNNGTLKFSVPTASFQYLTGVISGSGSLLKEGGTGLLRLENANTYTGGTTVNAGTLELDLDVAGNLVIPTASAVTVGASGTLLLSRNDGDITFGNVVSGSGTVKVDPHTLQAFSVREFTISANNPSFTGTWKLAPTANAGSSLGSFRTNGATTVANLGAATVDVDLGGQLWLAAGQTVANNMKLTGVGFGEGAGGTPASVAFGADGTSLTVPTQGYGGIGALRCDTSTFSGTITLEGDARISAYNSSSTFSGTLTATTPGTDDLIFGGGGTSSTHTITGNASGLGRIWVNGGGSTGTSTLVIGNGGTTGTLGAGDVVLYNDAQGAAINFRRSDGFTLGATQKILAAHDGTSTNLAKAVVFINTTGTGFTTNGGDILLTNGGSGDEGVEEDSSSAGYLGVGTTAAGSILNITGDTVVRTGAFRIGEAASTGGTVNQSGATSAVTVLKGFRLGHFASATSTYNLSAGTITLPDIVTAPTSEDQANLFIGMDGTGVFNLSGTGTLNATSVVVNGRSETHNGAAVDTLAITGGRMNIGKHGIRTQGTTYAVNLGNGTVGATADWTSALNMTLTATGGGNVSFDTVDAANGVTPRTITLTGVLSGSGGLTKKGAGSLVLGGASGTFTGTARSEGGTLYVGANAATTATVQPATGGIVQPGTVSTPATSTVNTLSMAGGTAFFRLGTTSDKFNVTTLTVPSASKIDFAQGTGFAIGAEYVLIDYTGSIGGSGFGALSLANSRLIGTLSNDTTNTQVKLTVTAVQDVLWKGDLSGNWDLDTTSNWRLSVDNSATKFLTLDSVKLTDSGLTRPNITLTGTINPKSVSVENTTGTYTLGGTPITGTSTTTLAKSGAGTLVLTNDNTFAGATTVSGGTLQLGSGGSTGKLGTGNIAMSNNAALVINRGDAVTLLNVISGAGSLAKQGAGTLTLGVGNTFSGGTSITGGAITASVANALSTGAVVNDSTLNLTLGSGSYTFGAVSGTGTTNITLAAAGTTTNFATATTWAGYAGVLNVGVAQAAASGRVSINNSLPATATVNVTANSTFSSASATANHAATVTLYGGDTGESVGQLRLDSGSIWSGPVTLAGNITGTNDAFVGTNSGIGTISGTIGETGGARNLSKSGSGTTQIAGNTTYTGGTTVLGGTLQLSGAGTLRSGTYPDTITLAASTTVLRHSSSANQILSGVITGTGGVTKDTSAASTLTLRGTNDYTGATTVLAGTLALDYSSLNTSKLADSSALVLGSGTLSLSGATGSHVEVVGSTTLTGAATLARSGGNTAKINLGTITLSGGVLNVTESATLASTTTALDAGNLLAGVTVNGQLATKDGSNNIIANAEFTDVNRRGGSIASVSTTNVRIIEAGSTGNVTLAAASGTTGINTLTNGGTGGLSTVDIGAGKTLRLGAFGSVIAGPTSLGLTFTNGTLTAGGADNTAGTIAINNNSAVATTVASVVANNGTGAIALATNGSGGTVLTAVNTYTGTTSISSGSSLTIGGSGSLGSSGIYAGLINNGGSLRHASSAAQTFSGIISGTGSLVKETGTAVLSLTAKNSYAGGTTVSAGTLSLDGTGGVDGIIIGEVTVNSGAVLRLNGGSVLGTGTSGTQVTAINLVGGNLHNNVTTTNQTLTNGVINMTGASITGIAASNIDFFRGTAALNSLASSTTSTVSTVTLTIRQSTGLTITTADGAAAVDLEIASPIANNTGFATAPLVKAGAGTLALTGTSTITGPLTIGEGTLQLGNGGTAGSIPAVAVTNNATLAFNRSDALAITNVIGGTGALVQAGSGTTTLNAVNTYTGETQVLAGSLVVANDCLADSSTVRIASGATLNLSHANTDTIDKLYINGVQQAAGLYKSSTGAGAGTILASLSGTGKLQVTTGPAASTPYSTWASTAGLTVANNGKGQDPDNDGRPNILEYALNGNPLSGADDGKMRARAETVGGDSVFTLTLPVRTGAVFTGATAKTATLDGVTYRIEGSDTTLTDWSLVITEVSPATTGNPTLPPLDSGWSYRTFQTPGAINADPADFLRVKVDEVVTP